jgi:SGNH domain (fused to AT3 domains)
MLSLLAERSGLSGRQVTQSTCGPLLGAWRMKREPWREKKCLEYQEGIIRFIEANPGLKLVVLSANWTSYERHVGWNGLDLVTGQDAGAIDPTPRTLKFHF